MSDYVTPIKVGFHPNDFDRIIEAVGWYTEKRRSFSTVFAQKHYRKKDGTQPTLKEVKEALAEHTAMEELLAKLINIKEETTCSTVDRLRLS